MQQKLSNKNVVILIDECQNLPFETLEQLRMLSNLETEKEKLLQIIMVGQPELLDILSSPELRQLNQRITVRYHLYPLDYKEMVEYIYHRLRVAGSDGSLLFTDKALKRIYKHSAGVPRIINVVCDNSLLAAYVAESKKVTLPIVNKAIKEIKGKKPLKDLETKFFSWHFSVKRVIKYAVLGSTALFILFFFVYFNDFKESIGMHFQIVSNTRQLYETALSRLRMEKVKLETISDLVKRESAVNSQASAIGVSVQQGLAINPNPSLVPVLELLSLWNVNKKFVSTIETKYQFADTLDFEQIALSVGLSTVLSWADFNVLLAFNIPVLLEVSDPDEIRKYVLVKKIQNGQITVVDGKEEFVMNREALKNIFIGNAVYFIRGVINSDEIFYRSSVGKAVEEIQSHLKDTGYYLGAIDGKYSDAVSTSVRSFQQAKGLNPDGIVDINTRLALYGAVKSNKIPHLQD
ncbi:MAG: peptidoglycan-binding protein [bacterium]|nr:peptidoglycan-binding protein [bacterium]